MTTVFTEEVREAVCAEMKSRLTLVIATILAMRDDGGGGGGDVAKAAHDACEIVFDPDDVAEAIVKKVMR
jgi:hypothetical protein